MPSQNAALGPFEQQVLTAIYNLGGEDYGVPIQEKVSMMSGKPVNYGSLYVTLNRLEDKGYLSSEERDAGDQRRGTARRYFRLEGPGLEALQESMFTNARVAEFFQEAGGFGKWKRHPKTR